MLASISVLAFTCCRKSSEPQRAQELARSAKAPAYATLPAGSSSPECGPESGKVTEYQGEGQVLRVDAAQGRVTIAHKEIIGFMAAMTMTFRVKDSKLLDRVKPGDRVEFTLEEAPQSVTISSIKKKPTG
jgi:Cu/Ag efflux protein CusF